MAGPDDGVEGPRVAEVPAPAFEQLLGVADVRHLEAVVVQHAQPLERRKGVVEHELDVVDAVGKLELHPGKLLLVAAAPPQLDAPQDVPVETHRPIEGVRDEPDVHEACGDAVIAAVGGTSGRRPPGGAVLHELDDVAVGILDRERQAAVVSCLDLFRNLDSPGGEPGAHRLGVVGDKAEPLQPVGAGLPLRDELDVLEVVDPHDRPVRLAGNILVAEDVPVECDRLLDVVGVGGEVRKVREPRTPG